MTAMAQSVAISDDGSVADGSAILKTQPRILTTTYDKEQRDAITAAAAGFTDLVY
jgi:hypothetical protein